MKKNEEKKARFSISIPSNLAKQIDAEAKKNRWSRVVMINFIIETYFETPEEK